MNRWLAALCVTVIVLTGCATPEPPAVAPPVVADPAPLPVPRTEQPRLRRDTLKHLANRQLKPIETRPLNARARCQFKDETGYRGRLRLDVKEASVQRFEAQVDVPKHGSCRFDLKQFQQTERLPNVVLAARQGACKVSLWEQGDQVTVAFRNCRTECNGASADYLWPILVDNRKGSCS
jgi:hypothetical protein